VEEHLQEVQAQQVVQEQLTLVVAVVVEYQMMDVVVLVVQEL
jgi:hypothetical protein